MYSGHERNVQLRNAINFNLTANQYYGNRLDMRYAISNAYGKLVCRIRFRNVALGARAAQITLLYLAVLIRPTSEDVKICK